MEINLKNPMSGAEQEHEYCGHVVFTGIGVLLVSNLVVLGDNFKLNSWREKKENEQLQWKLLITFS